MSPIRGAKGGGKGSGGDARTPVESPDSLRSRQRARVIDVWTEGEAEGLVNELQSVFLNDVPVQNPDGTFNFQGVTLVTRNGTQSQSYVEGFGGVESENSVSVKVLTATPVVRTISDTNANAIRVTISVPQLSQTNITNGDTNGAAVALAIDLQSNGGGYVAVVEDTISGKTTSRYQRAYRIALAGDGPWDIRVRRISADSTSQTLQNDIYWDSFTQIIDAKLTYPNTALAALEVDSEQFQSIPKRGYEVKGIKVRIPSNYDPIARTYAGAWNGTFTVAWSNNPAWCFYDLLTSARYGLGAFLDASQIDKWSLYQIGRYCDEMVDDGLGGQEPRFTCSLYLQTRDEAYNVINMMASIFCGLAYWSGGSVVATQDSPSEPVALYANANVVPDQGGVYFTYSGSSVKTRHTVALVSWNDPADRYRQKIEYVADEEGINKYGIVETEVVAFGCTSRGQAHRYGRRILYAERMETETVSFTTGLDGLAIAPGEIIQTTDPVRAGQRMGGRLLSATINSVTLDQEVTIVDGKTFTLWGVLPNGNVESREVINAPGVTANLIVTPDFSDSPQTMSMWVLAASDLVPEKWRVISISEADGVNAKISALAYRADKYDAIERGILLEPLPTSSLNGTPATPIDLVISESLYLVTSVLVGTRLTISWLGNESYYELQYRKKDGNWIVVTTSNTSIDIQPVDAGTYEFRIVSVNAVGRRSLPRSVTQEVMGKTAPPVDISDFAVIKSSGVAVATWGQHPDLDVRIGGRIVIRHSPWLVDVDWNDGYILEEFGGDVSTGVLPLITGTYFAKARDSSGNWSENAVSFIATEGMITGFTTVGTSIQAPLFDGIQIGVAVVSGALQLDGAVLIDDITDLIDSWSVMDALGGTAARGTYQFDAVMDLGAVATRRFEADIVARSFDTGDLIDSRLMLIDGWDAFDGGVVNDCDVTLFAQTTDDDPTVDPRWSEPTPYFVSDFTCRAIRHRLDFSSGQGTHNIAVSQLTVHAKVPA